MLQFRFLRLGLTCIVLLMVASAWVIAPAAHAATTSTYRLVPAPKEAVTLSSLDDLRSAATSTCQRTLHPNVVSPFTIGISAVDAHGTPINNAQPVNLSQLPYTITYKISVTNNSQIATLATTLSFIYGDLYPLLLNFEAGIGKAPKTITHKVPALDQGKTYTYSFKHTYASGADVAILASVDAQCRQDFIHPQTISTGFVLLAPTADIVPAYTFVFRDSGPVAPSFSLASTSTFELHMVLINLGQMDATADVQVHFVSPLIGKSVSVPILAAELPLHGGNSVGYTLTDNMNQILLFTAKTVTKTTLIPLAATVTLLAGDTSKAKSRAVKYPITLRPQGIDLTATISVAACPIKTGQQATVNVLIYNNGSQDMQAGSTIQISYDGQATPPQSLAAIQAGNSTGVQAIIQFGKIGKHTISVTIDPTKSVADYNRTNNTTTITRYAL